MATFSIKVLRVQGEILLEVEAATSQAALAAALEQSKAAVFEAPTNRRVAVLAQHAGTGCALVRS
jgi:hypothetical protein